MATVETWTGSHGGHVLSQSVSDDRPVYATGTMHDAVAMGTSTFLFDGVDDFLGNEISSALGTLPNTGTYSVLSFQNRSGDASGDRVVWGWGTDAGEPQHLKYDDSETKWEISGTLIQVSSSISGTSVGIFRDDNTTSKLAINNTTGSADDSDLEPEIFRIGARAEISPAQFLSGSIAEIMIFDRSLQDVEVESYRRRILKNYLNPLNIPNLQHRWKTDFGMFLKTGSIDTSSWTDSISGFNMTANVDSNREPEFIRFQDGFANHRSYASASAAADKWNTTPTPAGFTAIFESDFTIFVVVEKERLVNQQTVFHLFDPFDDSTPPESVSLFFTGGSDALRLTFTSASLARNYDGPVMDTTGLAAIACAYKNSGTSSFVLNGFEQTVTAAPRNATLTEVSSAFYVQGRIGGSNPMGKLFEFMIFDRALSFGEMQNLTSYAKLVYDID